MSEAIAEAIELGEIEPARSRHAGERSALALAGDAVVVGTPDGDLVSYGLDSHEVRWRVGDAVPGSAVTAVPFAGGVAVGTRGSAGTVAYIDASGTVRWRYETASEVGEPSRESRFYLPYVADAAATDDRLIVAARRYERDGENRIFRSCVYAFEPDGTVDWRYRADASPISLTTDGDRVAVAYNRCPGEHGDGLVVLDADAGDKRLRWDPEGDGQRSVGDVSLLPEGFAVASHADYRGYRTEPDGSTRWRVDLARPREIGEETLYAYPNHVHATPTGAVFVTGNTYPQEGRETESRHPNEHAAFGVNADGQSWRADVGGFSNGVATDGSLLAVPAAQNFRTRDPDTHGVTVLSVDDGVREQFPTDGIVTAVALDDGELAAVEEPVVYHDDGQRRGVYRLHLRSFES